MSFAPGACERPHGHHTTVRPHIEPKSSLVSTLLSSRYARIPPRGDTVGNTPPNRVLFPYVPNIIVNLFVSSSQKT